MNHDCVANTRLTMRKVDNELTVFAATKIAANSPILFNYVNALDTTETRWQIFLVFLQTIFVCKINTFLHFPPEMTLSSVYVHFFRQKTLAEFKFFRCKCHRCQDPTELGTFNSAVASNCECCSDSKSQGRNNKPNIYVILKKIAAQGWVWLACCCVSMAWHSLKCSYTATKSGLHCQMYRFHDKLAKSSQIFGKFCRRSFPCPRVTQDCGYVPNAGCRKRLRKRYRLQVGSLKRPGQSWERQR